MKINIREEKGEQCLNGLIKLTESKESKQDTTIKELEEQGVFN